MTNILVIEDEVNVTKNICKFLGRLDNTTMFGAVTSKEGFKIIEENQLGMVILDYNLNERYTGMDVFRKAQEKNPKITGIVITGCVETKLLEECKEVGITDADIIQKPMSLVVLRDLVKRKIADR